MLDGLLLLLTDIPLDSIRGWPMLMMLMLLAVCDVSYSLSYDAAILCAPQRAVSSWADGVYEEVSSFPRRNGLLPLPVRLQVLLASPP